MLFRKRIFKLRLKKSPINIFANDSHIKRKSLIARISNASTQMKDLSFSHGAIQVWRPPPSGAWVRRVGTVASTPATSYRAMQPDGRVGHIRHRPQETRAAPAARRAAHQAQPTATPTAAVADNAAREGSTSGAQQRARRGTEKNLAGSRARRARAAQGSGGRVKIL